MICTWDRAIESRLTALWALGGGGAESLSKTEELTDLDNSVMVVEGGVGAGGRGYGE